MVKYISWNDELSIVLIKRIQKKGGHVYRHGEKDEVWNRINRVFFEQPELEIWKHLHEEGNYRKLHLRYKELRDWFEAQTEIRNKSAILSAEPNELYNLMTML